MKKTELKQTKKLKKPDGTVVYYLDNKLHNPDGNLELVDINLDT